MERIKILLTVIALVCCLFAKDFSVRFLPDAVPLTTLESSEEKESSEKKEKETGNEGDEKKISVIHFSAENKRRSFIALAIVSERRYHSPSHEVISPPPERA